MRSITTISDIKMVSKRDGQRLYMLVLVPAVRTRSYPGCSVCFTNVCTSCVFITRAKSFTLDRVSFYGWTRIFLIRGISKHAEISSIVGSASGNVTRYVHLDISPICSILEQTVRSNQKEMNCYRNEFIFGC